MPRDAPLVYDSADAAGSTVYSYRVTSIASVGVIDPRLAARSQVETEEAASER